MSPPAKACSARPARKQTPSPRTRVTTSATRKVLARECLATKVASTRKQNVAVEADNQLSCQPNERRRRAQSAHMLRAASTPKCLACSSKAAASPTSSSPTQTTRKPDGFSFSVDTYGGRKRSRRCAIIGLDISGLDASRPLGSQG